MTLLGILMLMYLSSLDISNFYSKNSPATINWAWEVDLSVKRKTESSLAEQRTIYGQFHMQFKCFEGNVLRELGDISH